MRPKISKMKAYAKTRLSALGGVAGRREHWFTRGHRRTADLYGGDSGSQGNDAICYKNDALKKMERADCVGGHIPWAQSSSYGMTDVDVLTCHEELPSTSEVIVVVDEILDAMRTQRIELRNMRPGQSLTTFHHILPVRCLQPIPQTRPLMNI